MTMWLVKMAWSLSGCPSAIAARGPRALDAKTMAVPQIVETSLRIA
jgi:hypothetical protein